MKSKIVEEKAKKIQLDRIGDSCVYDAISCMLEYLDKLYWALDYVEYKFLYEPNRFLEFNQKDTFILAPTDSYYFLSSTGSRAYKDISEYTYRNYEKNLGKMISTRDVDIEKFFDVIQSFSEMKAPLCLFVDNLEYRDFYKENGFTVPRSHCKHFIDVLEVSSDGKKCFVFDRGFDCFGQWIDTEMLYAGAAGEFLEKKNSFEYMYFADNKPFVMNASEIKEKFITNLNRTLQFEVKIGKYSYLNNSKALQAFKKDFKLIVNSLEKNYGNMTAAMIGEAILLQVDGAMGVVGLYRYINSFIKSNELELILPEIRYYWEIWHKFEMRLKYVTYKDEALHNYNSTFISYIDELIELDSKIVKGIKKVLKELA